LRDGGCLSYSAESDNKKYLLKIVKPNFLDTAIQSTEIMNYLSESGFPVPRIIPTADGKLYDFSEGRMFLLFEFIEGREPEPGEKIEEIGELTGRLHNIMENHIDNLPIREKPFFIDRYIELLRRKKYPEQKILEFIQYGNELWERVKELPRSYCHGDLHRGNLLITSSNQIYFLDFDTSCIAAPVFDIMVMCDTTDYFNFKQEGYAITKQIFERFLKGYQKYRSLSDKEYAAFYDFIAIRHYQLQATILEIYGLDCVDEVFINQQLEWLRQWRELCEKINEL
jgi:Ser/Thr protein kinase RdoA (MazF antagonist)